VETEQDRMDRDPEPAGEEDLVAADRAPVVAAAGVAGAAVVAAGEPAAAVAAEAAGAPAGAGVAVAVVAATEA